MYGRPRNTILLRSKHDRRRGRMNLEADSADLADPGSHYTRRVVEGAGVGPNHEAERTGTASGIRPRATSDCGDR